MDTALAVHRFHFAFTVTYHYIFPQLTMGLALLVVVLKTLALPSLPYTIGCREPRNFGGGQNTAYLFRVSRE